MDLVIFYSPEKCCVTYYINNDSAGYKIEYPFSYIKNIVLENPDVLSNAEGASQRPGGLLVELNRPPNFFMDSSGSGGFYQCGDFTEDQQASQILVHQLGGHPKVLSGQLAKLVSLEAFQNRHSFHDPNTLAVSAPVSPIHHRPASQPNHIVHPHMNMFQESLPVGMGFQAARGHKRQRSRSVPVAIDFSMLRQHPMPSFLIQQEPPAPYVPQPGIFAPIPQHHSGMGPIGPNLSIDTSAGYGLDYRQYPMSATTANSPSEYGTPALFTSGQQQDTITAPNFSTPYSVPYLSPMVDPASVIAPPVSPLSMTISHGDPVIANQSPPLSLGRSAPADMYPLSQDNSLTDEALSFTDIYSKHSMTLPFRTALEDGQDDFDMTNLLSFGTTDPTNLSPDNSAMYKLE